jgi:uncharacterized LabA/DUF88 family protein
MANISVFVDGFNLYHSLADNEVYSKYKWLDISKLIKTFVSEKKHVIRIYYFTSFTEWDTEKMSRHQTFIKALESTGIKIIYGKFKKITRKCRNCKTLYQTYEEKRTDVNIAVSILRKAKENEYDRAIILSGDSDLIPSVENVKEIYPEKRIGLLIPIGRESDELAMYCHNHTQIQEKQLKSCQFPPIIKISDNEIIECPTEWR